MAEESEVVLNFKNESKLCWLNSMAVFVANNSTFDRLVKHHENSFIKKIIKDYNSARRLFNTNEQGSLKEPECILSTLQQEILNYLTPSLRYKKGSPESAFVALLNLINHDTSLIKEELTTTWMWFKQCSSCYIPSQFVVQKPILTIKSCQDFHPTEIVAEFTCCGKRQNMMGIFKEVSDCLIFHFEDGAGFGQSIPLQFFINEKDYELTCIILYMATRKSHDRDHFVTYLRKPYTDIWAKCDDLEDTVVCYCVDPPVYNLKNLYMCVYESFGKLGKEKIESSFDEDSAVNFCEEIDLVYSSD